MVPVETPEEDEDLASGAAVCFQNRKQLNIPDVRRSQYLNTRTKQNSPRSAMIVPLTTQGDVLGVLEAGNAQSRGIFHDRGAGLHSASGESGGRGAEAAGAARDSRTAFPQRETGRDGPVDFRRGERAARAARSDSASVAATGNDARRQSAGA